MDAFERAVKLYCDELYEERPYSTSHVTLHEGRRWFGRDKFDAAVTLELRKRDAQRAKEKLL